MHALGRSCPWTGHAPAAAQRQRLCHSVRICRRACWQPVTYHLRPCRAAQERSSATSTMDFPALSPSEQSLAEQLQSLLEMTTAHSQQASQLIQQMDLKLVTTSDAANTPPTLVTDTLADEAEEGGGDGMAAGPSASAPAAAASSAARPAAAPAAPNSAQPGTGIPAGGTMGIWGWGQSALQQLSARKAFANMYGLEADAGMNAGGGRGPEGARNPRFDPLDTLDDEEDDDSSDDEDLYGGGYEGGVLPVAKQPGQRLWPRPGKMTPDVGRFLGKVSSKIVSKVASKVNGLGKAAAQRIGRTVADPAGKAISSAWPRTVGKGAEVAGKAVSAAAGAVAAAAASLPTPAKAAAAAAAKSAKDVYAVAKGAPGKLMELGSGPKSTWLVVDSPAGGGLFPTANHPVRVVAIHASAELTKVVKRIQQQHEAATGLVSFESYRLGVKVPGPVYAEASAMYQTLLPLIIDYVAENPRGRVCFTGEGVGGSLATVLGLMAASRGLRPHCMLPLVVAFDAPPVLAEVVSGALWGCGGAQQDECDSTDWTEMVEDVTARGLLSTLGLPHNAVLNLRSPGSRAPEVIATIAPPAPKAAAAGAAGAAAGSAQAAAARATSPGPAAAASSLAAAASSLSHLVSGAAAGHAGKAAGQAASPPPAGEGVAGGTVDEDTMPASAWQAQQAAAGNGKGAAGAARGSSLGISLPSTVIPAVPGADEHQGHDEPHVNGTHQELNLFKLVGEVRVLV